MLGCEEAAADARFAGNAARVENRAELRRLLEARLRARTAREWAGLLTDARVPAGEVNDIAGAFALASRLGLEPVVEVPRGGGAPSRLTRNPIRLSATPASFRERCSASANESPSG